MSKDDNHDLYDYIWKEEMLEAARGGPTKEDQRWDFYKLLLIIGNIVLIILMFQSEDTKFSQNCFSILMIELCLLPVICIVLSILGIIVSFFQSFFDDD